MERRKFVVGLGSLAAGGAAAMGTGAFSSATVKDRSFSGDVTTDNNALLRLDPTVSDHASQVDGKLEISIGGLNQDADFTFPQVFRIHNNGSETVDITLSLGSNPGDAVTGAPSTKNGGTSTTDLLDAGETITITSGGYIDVGVELTVTDGVGSFTGGEFNVVATEP